MNESDKVILVILGRAIQSEEAGNSFYRQMAEKWRDSTGRELFLKLASEETTHEAELKAEYDEISNRCNWQPYEGAATYKFLDHLDVELPFLDEGLPSFEGKEDLTGREALQLAVKVETASADFFLQAALAADHSRAKEFFVDLAKSEINHATILEKELARVTGA